MIFIHGSYPVARSQIFRPGNDPIFTCRLAAAGWYSLADNLGGCNLVTNMAEKCNKIVFAAPQDVNMQDKPY
jgi:hypothetical protein